MSEEAAAPLSLYWSGGELLFNLALSVGAEFL